MALFEVEYFSILWSLLWFLHFRGASTADSKAIVEEGIGLND